MILSKECDRVTIRFYSASFRLVMAHAVEARFTQGQAEVVLPAERFAMLARGTYYWQAEARAAGDEHARSPASVILIQR